VGASDGRSLVKLRHCRRVQVKEAWTSYTLDLVNYQNKTRLIRGWDDLFAKCGEHINSLAAMKHSPYYKVFEEEASGWEDRLNRVHLLFDVWIDVQRQWVYLEYVSSQRLGSAPQPTKVFLFRSGESSPAAPTSSTSFRSKRSDSTTSTPSSSR
jgi:hypothetical protein